MKPIKTLGGLRRLQKIEQYYNELIMEVTSKFPNETRHETALRYIRDRETMTVGAIGQQEVKLVDANANNAIINRNKMKQKG